MGEIAVLNILTDQGVLYGLGKTYEQAEYGCYEHRHQSKAKSGSGLYGAACLRADKRGRFGRIGLV